MLGLILSAWLSSRTEGNGAPGKLAGDYGLCGRVDDLAVGRFAGFENHTEREHTVLCVLVHCGVKRVFKGRTEASRRALCLSPSLVHYHPGFCPSAGFTVRSDVEIGYR